VNESAPYIPPQEAQEQSADDESSQSKRAEVLAKLFHKLRRIEQGVETEVDENTRQFKTSLRFMGMQLGATTNSATPSDDE
jgi:hypothetical protein